MTTYQPLFLLEQIDICYSKGCKSQNIEYFIKNKKLKKSTITIDNSQNS